MRRPAMFVLIIASLILMTVPLVAAEHQKECICCRHTIKVIPVGSTKTGEPIVTATPANLMIFHTGKGPIKNVWLLIVLNESTYNALNQITINDKQFMTKNDFQLVTAKKIPPLPPDSTTGYPGSLCQYNVDAIKDKIKEKGNPIYYSVKFFPSQIAKTPTTFTLAVELSSSANLKALILALGRYDSTGKCHWEIECLPSEPFNVCSSFSNSTLVVPEIAILALTSAPFCGAIGFYTIKHRKRQKSKTSE